MARSVVYSCDVCGKQKGDANHWWDVWVESEGPQEGDYTLSVAVFSPNAEDDHRTACGERCVIVLMSRFMKSGSLDERAPEVLAAPVMEGGQS